MSVSPHIVCLFFCTIQKRLSTCHTAHTCNARRSSSSNCDFFALPLPSELGSGASISHPGLAHLSGGHAGPNGLHRLYKLNSCMHGRVRTPSFPSFVVPYRSFLLPYPAVRTLRTCRQRSRCAHQAQRASKLPWASELPPVQCQSAYRIHRLSEHLSPS